MVRGDGRGRTIGIPTANIAPVNETLPAQRRLRLLGFASGGPTACPAGGGQRGPAADLRRGRAITVEAHLLDFDGDLYGAAGSACPSSARLRGEQAFPGADALVAQIREDIERRACGARGAAGISGMGYSRAVAIAA